MPTSSMKMQPVEALANALQPRVLGAEPYTMMVSIVALPMTARFATKMGLANCGHSGESSITGGEAMRRIDISCHVASRFPVVIAVEFSAAVDGRGVARRIT